MCPRRLATAIRCRKTSRSTPGAAKGDVAAPIGTAIDGPVAVDGGDREHALIGSGIGRGCRRAAIAGGGDDRGASCEHRGHGLGQHGIGRPGQRHVDDVDPLAAQPVEGRRDLEGTGARLPSRSRPKTSAASSCAAGSSPDTGSPRPAIIPAMRGAVRRGGARAVREAAHDDPTAGQCFVRPVHRRVDQPDPAP